jgi:hypothetical protein
MSRDLDAQHLRAWQDREFSRAMDSVKERAERLQTQNEVILLKAVRLALLEFERIGYQIKADPTVIVCLEKAIKHVEDHPCKS